MPPPALPPILAEGRTWLVIDKPAGLAVHPGPRTPHSLEALLPLLAQHGQVPQPVHRLDRDTSGCLLLARRRSALRVLGAAFATRGVQKRYWALAEGEATQPAGEIDLPLSKRSTAGAGWRMVADAGGQPASTRWRLLAAGGGRSLIEFQPLTGRTHQIRVHAAHVPGISALVGDPVYGRADAAGLMLHARALIFPEPQTGEILKAEAPVPDRFQKLAPALVNSALMRNALGQPAHTERKPAPDQAAGRS